MVTKVFGRMKRRGEMQKDLDEIYSKAVAKGGRKDGWMEEGREGGMEGVREGGREGGKGLCLWISFCPASARTWDVLFPLMAPTEVMLFSHQASWHCSFVHCSQHHSLRHVSQGQPMHSSLKCLISFNKLLCSFYK